MCKNIFSILLSIMSFCLISCQLLIAQTSFHRILKDEKFLQYASVVLLEPVHASFGKNIFSDVYEYTDKSNAT